MDEQHSQGSQGGSGANNSRPEADWTRRTVPEWRADHPDQAIPDRVKLRIFERQGGKCALTGKKLMPGETDYDHIKRLRDGGEHREANLQAVWRKAHREKSAVEQAEGAKADRIKARHFGLKTRKSSLSHPTLKRCMDGKVRPR